MAQTRPHRVYRRGDVAVNAAFEPLLDNFNRGETDYLLPEIPDYPRRPRTRPPAAEGN